MLANGWIQHANDNLLEVSNGSQILLLFSMNDKIINYDSIFSYLSELMLWEARLLKKSFWQSLNYARRLHKP